MPNPRRAVHTNARANAAAATIPTVSCDPVSTSCDNINTSAGGAVGVPGLNAVESAENTPDTLYSDIEPADQGLCAGNGYVVEDNNVGEIQIFNSALSLHSSVISLDAVMGLAKKGWSSGGDISCAYDSSNGGHWFFTEFVSASKESKGGPFAGCFAAKANSCYEGIAVTKGNDPFGPYWAYYLNSDYNPAEPGYPYLLNDFAKIAVTRDAFLLFYDEFPLRGNGVGGGFFNGAQEYAFDKNAFEKGVSATSPSFTVAIENMGTLTNPDGTCAKDNKYSEPSISCWFSVIPAMPPDTAEYDNSHGGSGFMLDTLDYYGLSDNRLAVFDWTELSDLNSTNCSSCTGSSGIKFGGQLFSGVETYYDNGELPDGFVAPQKYGPTPLGDECGAAGLSVGNPPPASCPEGGIATNGDNITQASQAQGELWGAVSTEVDQTYASDNVAETHMGAAYWVIGTSGFDSNGTFTLTSQGYVTAAHEDLEFPAMAAESTSANGGNGGAIMDFTLSGNGGPTGADGGGFYPSTAYGTLTSTSAGLTGSTINIADMGQAPQDGFTEYQGYPDTTRARWGDYSNAIYLPDSGNRIYFATNYIQSPNCAPPEFTLTTGTCDGTRDGFANWGTSVNYVVP